MTRDPLQAVLRLRELAVGQARRELAGCIEAESAAGAVAEAADRAIMRETLAATDLATGDAEVEAFAAWLPEARRRAREAYSRRENAALETTCARAALAASRAGAEAVTNLIEKRRTERQAELARKDQAALDEAGSRPWTHPNPPGR